MEATDPRVLDTVYFRPGKLPFAAASYHLASGMGVGGEVGAATPATSLEKGLCDRVGETGCRLSSQPVSLPSRNRAGSRLAGPSPSPTLGESCPFHQSSSRSWDSRLPSGRLVGQQRQEMSNGSLAALPASDENAEAAVEGRGAGLAAKARCPAAVRRWPSASGWPGAPRMCQGNEACGRGDVGSWHDLRLGLPGGRGAAGPRGCSGPLSPITSGCSGLSAFPLSRWPGAGAG